MYLFRCCLDRNAKRWANTRSPRLNTIVFIYGVPSDITANGFLQIAIKSMAFNVGGSLTSASPNIIAPTTPSGKHRKFSAEATTQRQPATSSSVASSSYGAPFFFVCISIHANLGKRPPSMT
jgi:hypothetical protein